MTPVHRHQSDRGKRAGHLGSFFNLVGINMATPRCNTDGEVVIMLAFQASGTGSIPVRCSFF